MKKSFFGRLAALLLALVLLFALTGCTIVRDVAELASVLIESAEITNSDDPVPSAQNVPEPLYLLPEKEASDQMPQAQSPEEAAEETVEEAPAQPENASLQDEADELPEEEEPPVLLGHSYTSKDDVALYLHLYQQLPPNFITKTEARAAGWEGGGLEGFADIPSGSCIGGDRFGNNEGLLPRAKNRSYYECDIDTQYAKSRGAKRIVYSNDGLIYYTEDHYEHFELLYGEE